MAIKNIVARGVGFGLPAWIVTRGFGAVADGGSSTANPPPETLSIGLRSPM